METDGLAGILVRFDPTGVEPGIYTAVLVINSKSVQHPTHPFTSYYELTLQAEVVADSEIFVDPQWLDFDDTTIFQTSDTLSIEITNLGTEESKLTISQWFFGGNNF